MHKIAAPYKRLLAVLIDLLLIIPLITVAILAINRILQLPVTPDYGNIGLEIKMDAWAREHFWQIVVLYSFVKLMVLFFYFTSFEASAWQGTPGKRLLRLAVTDLQGQRISFGRSTIRFFSRILAAQLVLGYLMIFFTKYKQGLHDLIAKTLVQQTMAPATSATA